MATLYPDGKGGYTPINPAIANAKANALNNSMGTGSLFNYSALNQRSPYSVMRRSGVAPSGFMGVNQRPSSIASSGQPINYRNMNQAENLFQGVPKQTRTGAVDTPPNWRKNLLNYIVSPKGQGMAQGLLEASGYSKTPVSFGQAMALGMQRGNQAEATAAATQLAKDKFAYQKDRDIVQDVFTELGLDLEFKKLLQPNLSNFAKELRDVGIDPESPKGRKLLIDKITKAQTKIELSSGEIDKEKLKYSLRKLNEEQKIVNAGRELDGRLQIMEGQLQNQEFETGFFEGYKLPFAQAMNALGLLDDAEVDKIANLEFFQAASSYMIPRMRAIGSGATSDFEIKLYTKAAPNIKNTKEGNIFIVAGMRAINKFNDHKFKEMEKWVFENDSIKGFDDYYNKEFGGNIFKSASTDEEFNMMVADGKLKVGDLFLNKKNNKFVVITEEMLK